MPSPVAVGQDGAPRALRREPDTASAPSGGAARLLARRDGALVQWARRAPGGCGGCGWQAGRQRAGGPRGGGVLRQAGGGGEEDNTIGGEGACRSGRGRHGEGWQQRGLVGAAASEGEGDGFDGRGRGACCRKGAAAGTGKHRKGWGWGGVLGCCRDAGSEGPGEGQVGICRGERWGGAGVRRGWGGHGDWRWGS